MCQAWVDAGQVQRTHGTAWLQLRGGSAPDVVTIKPYSGTGGCQWEKGWWAKGCGEGHENPQAKSTAEESGKEKQSGEKVISARADVHGEDNRGVLAGQAKKFLPNC